MAQPAPPVAPRLLTGLSAFPLTPLTDETDAGIDEGAFRTLVTRAAAAAVDSITVLGSTGSYAYLTRDERRRVVQLAAQEAGDVPVLAGVGATRTRDVLRYIDDAQQAGAAALLLAPVSYQPLSDEEVYALFEDVTAAVSVPVVVYDNPGTTHFTFSDDLHARIAQLPAIASIKIPPDYDGPDVLQERVDNLRSQLPAGVTIGISGDDVAAEGLNAGCDTWYSVLAGTVPDPCRAIVDAAGAGDAARTAELSNRLMPLWNLFFDHGSYRVTSAVAEELGLVAHPNLPRPVRGLDPTTRHQVRDAIATMRANGVPGLDPVR
ncbi:dihydrodipicolinate synthase family protein [Nocardioides sp. zg-1308]|uniref:dihydrodipicolinate synthase family protein n=1 Tax=Nocardioides sp. zg-1308 TaxID=2736253 RepID=UPI001C130DAD|nr:dihydrodipicolinate synthase family protein [Nocardioides sp. zg-1308]